MSERKHQLQGGEVELVVGCGTPATCTCEGDTGRSRAHCKSWRHSDTLPQKLKKKKKSGKKKKKEKSQPSLTVLSGDLRSFFPLNTLEEKPDSIPFSTDVTLVRDSTPATRAPDSSLVLRTWRAGNEELHAVKDLNTSLAPSWTKMHLCTSWVFKTSGRGGEVKTKRNSEPLFPSISDNECTHGGVGVWLSG